MRGPGIVLLLTGCPQCQQSRGTVRAPGLPAALVPVCCEQDIVWARKGHQACQGRHEVLYTTGLRICSAACRENTPENTLHLTALLTVSLGGNTFLCLVQIANSGIRLFFEQKFHQLGFVAHHILLSASKPGCLMSHILLHTPDCKA